MHKLTICLANCFSNFLSFLSLSTTSNKYAYAHHKLDICDSVLIQCRSQSRHMPSMNSAAFNNPAVANSQNPGTFGWHHGEHMLRRVFYLNIYWAYAGTIPINDAGWFP